MVTIGRAKRDKWLQRSCRCVRGTSAHLARSAATHHTVFWSRGGSTDLDLLIGLCTRCHHLLHRGFLNITGNAVDGFVFTNNQGKLLRRRRRRQTGHRPAA
ncbi:HNH endonuclease signature motif containing protein [Aeromicrobium sp. P5_D10]